MHSCNHPDHVNDCPHLNKIYADREKQWEYLTNCLIGALKNLREECGRGGDTSVLGWGQYHVDEINKFVASRPKHPELPGPHTAKEKEWAPVAHELALLPVRVEQSGDTYATVSHRHAISHKLLEIVVQKSQLVDLRSK